MDLFRNQGKVHIETRERIQQGRGAGTCLQFWHLQLSQLVGELFALGAQRGVLPADRVTKLLLLTRVKGVGRVIASEAVSESADETGLALADGTDGTDGTLQRCPLLGNAIAGVIRRPSGF
ncbi:hypothetical protein [Streptomyces sp. C10-9-1]|uniref:hypothetical protein n=1 Tax=Streptomyces sp. C10-9-1 TaxID=1859285 RepID=UPI003D745C46